MARRRRIAALVTGVAALSGGLPTSAAASVTDANEGLTEGPNEEDEAPEPDEGTEAEAPPAEPPAATPPAPPPATPPPATPAPADPAPAPQAPVPAAAPPPAPAPPAAASAPLVSIGSLAGGVGADSRAAAVPPRHERVVTLHAGRPESRPAPQTSQERPVPPVSAAAVADIAAVTPAPATHTATPARSPSSRATHTMRTGESLWSIARDRLGASASPAALSAEVERLWRLNATDIGTGDPDLVPAGFALRVD